jgi:hypothetical protein
MSYVRLLLSINLPLNDNKKSVMNSKKASYEEKEKKNNMIRNNERTERKRLLTKYDAHSKVLKK